MVAAAVAKQPLAAYTALLLTQVSHMENQLFPMSPGITCQLASPVPWQVGHSLPEVMERGLPLLRVVLEAGRLDHTMEVTCPNILLIQMSF